MVHEDRSLERSGDERSDPEVLSSHTEAEAATYRRKTLGVVIALMIMVPVGLAAHSPQNSKPSEAAGTSGHAKSFEKPPAESMATLSEANLVALVRTRCPHNRRLRMGNVKPSPFAEIAPCPRSRHGGPITNGPQNDESIRFARIVGDPSVIGHLAGGWIKVRCSDRFCSTPEVLLSAPDIAAEVIREPRCFYRNAGWSEGATPEAPTPARAPDRHTSGQRRDQSRLKDARCV